MRLFAAVLLFALGSAEASAYAESAQCTITEILATNEKKGIDGRLGGFKDKLTRPPFSAWDSFELLGEARATAERQKPATVHLENGTMTLLYKDKVSAQGGRARLRFGVDVDDKNGRRCASAIVTFDSGDRVLVAGDKLRGGTYIVAVDCTAQ